MKLDQNQITLLLDILASHWHVTYINGSDYSDGPTLLDIAADPTMREIIDLYCKLKAAFDQVEV